MRIIVDVRTVGESVEGFRKLAIEEIDKAISERMQRCVKCNEPFLAERGKRKKYCGDLCRWEASNSTAVDRYHNRKDAKIRIEAEKIMSAPVAEPVPIVSALGKRERSEAENQLARDRMAKVRAARKQETKV